MSDKRFTLRAAVYLMLIKNDNILLVRRFNTGWQDGKYSFVSGHLDGDETVRQAMIREAKEEAGIVIKSEDLHVVHTMHRKSNYEYIDFFLVASKWKGDPKNKEPDKCDELRWASLKKLPDNVAPNVKKAIENYNKEITFSEFGWLN